MGRHVSIALATLIAGCSAATPVTRAHRVPAARGSGARFSHPPVIGGSRRACLAPPFTPPSDAATLADGTPVRREADGRRWIVSIAGDAVPTGEQASALVQRLRARGGAFTWISYGLYCGEMPGGLCLHYAGNLCEMRIDEIARTLLDAIAADSIMPRPRIDLALELAGQLGPRCDGDDPACIPEPYDHGAHYDPNGSRHAGALAQYTIGTCAHDGDCNVAGCGNHCMSWEYGGANEAATCEGYVFSRPIFCGCVSGQCAWFSQ